MRKRVAKLVNMQEGATLKTFEEALNHVSVPGDRGRVEEEGREGGGGGGRVALGSSEIGIGFLETPPLYYCYCEPPSLALINIHGRATSGRLLPPCYSSLQSGRKWVMLLPSLLADLFINFYFLFVFSSHLYLILGVPQPGTRGKLSDKPTAT